ncbi:zinc finger CCHC domain-containing protein 7-like, partial [Centroberyx affinis]|uniref:zinc finger CCHC domain-containing protein 7-like n=1 Tax=Centroberyx affinis TaxID=166261 RepID=UPI003A5C0144
MYCSYQDRKELEDELYREEDEEDSEGSEVNSELEFHLYSQLHYSSNAGEREEQEDGGEKELKELEVTEKTAGSDGERKDSGQRHSVSGLRKHLKGHTEVQQKRRKLDKQKKRKADPKGQRSSSSFFQEVIVIDSSTDVISISEDDTDDGVCAFKGQKSRPLQASTPAQQATLKRKRSPSLGLVVDSVSPGSESEESESEESESESESDSDGLENWMILGRGKQDGDQCISLNLEGESDSNAGESVCLFVNMCKK